MALNILAIPGREYSTFGGQHINCYGVIYTGSDITDVIVRVNKKIGRIKVSSWNRIDLYLLEQENNSEPLSDVESNN